MSGAPELHGVVASTIGDADFELVAPGLGEAEGARGRQDRPGVVRRVRGEDVFLVTQCEIEIADLAVTDRVDTVAAPTSWNVERVVMRGIGGSLILEADGSEGLEFAYLAAGVGEPKQIGSGDTLRLKALGTGGPGLWTWLVSGVMGRVRGGTSDKETE